MSNQKKRQEARAQEVQFENMVSKRDQQIVGALKQAQVEEHMPFDKKVYTAFYSGAVWADEFPADKTKHRYFWLGFVVGALVIMAVVAILAVLLFRGVL